MMLKLIGIEFIVLWVFFFALATAHNNASAIDGLIIFLVFAGLSFGIVVVSLTRS